ncbi:hypothetical protein [Myxococcus sp. Y35]|uniref:hypothetical protein n=1 Tax=Pseudomyxococcus flavus TaxID=3115648 RepID=UPI003CEF7396
MKQTFAVLAAVIASTLVACGGVEPVETQEQLGEDSSALVSCSTSCSDGSTLSCTGTTCSAADGDHVQCNGNYQYCQVSPPPPPPDCTNPRDMCVNINGTRCATPGTSRDCCVPGVPTGGCFCRSNGTWICTIPAEP